MSFSIYLTSFRDKSLFPIHAPEVIGRFSAHIRSIEDDYGWWRLHFDEGPCLARLSMRETGTITGFSVLRPPDYLAFWDIIAGILKDFPCVLYWPGDHAVMGSLTMLQHLPDDFVEIHGIPWISTDSETIRDYVDENS